MTRVLDGSKIFIVSWLLVITACRAARDAASGKKADLPPIEEYSDDGAIASRLLTGGFLASDFVVSLKDGHAYDLGDSALFSGLTLGSLSCEAGRPIFTAIVADIKNHGGMIYRHPDLVVEDKYGPSST